MNIRTFVAILSRNPQYNFPKMRGGGSMAVWNFSENLSLFTMFEKSKKITHVCNWGLSFEGKHCNYNTWQINHLE